VAERLARLLGTYFEAGGEQPELLIYEERHGGPMVSMLARMGPGLPARVLPFRLDEIGLIGLDTLACAFAYGAVRVILLVPPRKRQEAAAVEEAADLMRAVLDGLGYGGERLLLLHEDDPQRLEAALTPAPEMAPIERASFLPLGGKRELLRLAFEHLHARAPQPVDVLPLPKGAPFGTIAVDVSGCTLCLSCVGACPAGALADNPDWPMLRFLEKACIQCGLCAATCPEKVIGLEPRLNFLPEAGELRTLKEEEPATCVRCGKPFGVRSSIERIVAQLAGSHWMFQDERQIARIRMCEDCRVIAEFEGGDRPLVLGTPRKPRTTEDYLRERDREAQERGRTGRGNGSGEGRGS